MNLPLPQGAPWPDTRNFALPRSGSRADRGGSLLGRGASRTEGKVEGWRRSGRSSAALSMTRTGVKRSVDPHDATSLQWHYTANQMWLKDFSAFLQLKLPVATLGHDASTNRVVNSGVEPSAKSSARTAREVDRQRRCASAIAWMARRRVAFAKRAGLEAPELPQVRLWCALQPPDLCGNYPDRGGDIELHSIQNGEPAIIVMQAIRARPWMTWSKALAQAPAST